MYILLQNIHSEERFRVPSASESRRWDAAAVRNLWQERFQVALGDEGAPPQVSPGAKQRLSPRLVWWCVLEVVEERCVLEWSRSFCVVTEK